MRVLVPVTIVSQFSRRFFSLFFLSFSRVASSRSSLFSFLFCTANCSQCFVKTLEISHVDRRKTQRCDRHEARERIFDSVSRARERRFAHFVTSSSHGRCTESLGVPRVLFHRENLSSRVLYTTLLYSIRACHHFRLMELALRGNRRGDRPLRHRRQPFA